MTLDEEMLYYSREDFNKWVEMMEEDARIEECNLQAQLVQNTEFDTAIFG